MSILSCDERVGAQLSQLTTYLGVIVSHFKQGLLPIVLAPHHTTCCKHVVTASKLGQAKMCSASSGDLPGEFNLNSITGQPEQKQLPASLRQREGLCLFYLYGSMVENTKTREW